MGDTPDSFGLGSGKGESGPESVFQSAAPDFTIYYLSSSAGFTSPTWHGYRTARIDETAYPAAPWLLQYGFAYDTDLHQHTTGDGVSLLMAYALNLNPNTHLKSSLPSGVLEGDTLTMTFHAASPGISYTPETSTDLQTWKTDGVTISDRGALRTASIRLDSAEQYLRLRVTD